MKKLILISGPAGVGKSTLSKVIAKEVGAVILDKDCIDDAFHPHDRGEFYTKEVEPKVLQAVLNLARLNLEAGRTVLLDIPWTHLFYQSSFWMDRIRGINDGENPLVIEMFLEDTQLQERMRVRGLSRDQFRLTKEGWAKFRETDVPHKRNPLPHFLVDASRRLEDYLPEVLKQIRLFFMGEIL